MDYFTPDAEDLRIGYEGEINYYDIFKEDNFVPFIINSGNVTDIICAPYDGYAVIRTLYLNEKQIISEGWEFRGFGYNTEKTYIFFKNNNKLIVWFNSPWGVYPFIVIEDYEGNIQYSGEAKSINEFRYICKLLKI